MDDIEEEIKKIEYEIEILNKKNYQEENEEELPKIEEVKEKPKPKSSGGRKGQSRERMMELHKIRSEKALEKKKEKEELKAKAEEIEKIKKDKINFEYEQAKQLKEAIEAKKAKQMKPNTKAITTNEDKENIEDERKRKELYKSASRDILKQKYLEEAKRRVMMDLFS